MKSLDQLISDNKTGRLPVSQAGFESRGMELVSIERYRQIDKEGHFPEGDAQAYQHGELGRAGACYADWHATDMEGTDPKDVNGELHPFWPFDPEDFKPAEDNLRGFVKAAALLVAQIDVILAHRDGMDHQP